MKLPLRLTRGRVVTIIVRLIVADSKAYRHARNTSRDVAEGRFLSLLIIDRRAKAKP